MKRSASIALGVGIGVVLCISCCAAVYWGMYVLAIAEKPFGIFPEVAMETMAEEKDALRDKGERIYEATLTGDPEVFADVWVHDGQHFPIRDATVVLESLAPRGTTVVGYRVEQFWSTTAQDGDREALATLVIERADNSEGTILIGVAETDGEYCISGVPSTSE